MADLKPKCPRKDDSGGYYRQCRNKPTVNVPGVAGPVCRKHAKQIRNAILWDNRQVIWAIENPDDL